MVRQTTKVILFEILGVLSLLIVSAGAILAFMLASGPVDLGFLKKPIERTLTASRDGREVEIRSLNLQWMTEERRLFIQAEGLTLKDEQGQSVSYAERSDLTLDAGAALRGKIVLLGLRLNRGWLDIRQNSLGQWSIAGEPLPGGQVSSWPQTPEAMLARMNDSVQEILAYAQHLEQALDLERLAFDNFDIRYRSDEDVETNLISAARGRIEKGQTGLFLSLAGHSETAFLPESFAFEFSISPDYSLLETRLDLGIVPFGSLLEQASFPLTLTGDMQVDTSLRLTGTQAAGLETLDLSLTHMQGTLQLPQLDEEISKLQAELVYKPAEDLLSIASLELTGQRIQTRLKGRIEAILSEAPMRTIEVQASMLDLDIVPVLEAPVQFRDLQLRASLAEQLRKIDVSELTVKQAGLEMIFSGGLDFGVETSPGQIPLKADLKAELRGDVGKADILRFWPVQLGQGARLFVEERIETIQLVQTRAELSLRPDSFAEGHLRDEDLRVTFSYRDGLVRFMDDLPSVREAQGEGRLSGNSFFVQAIEGLYDSWELQLVEVDFPVLNPKGGDFTVTAIGTGPVQAFMQSLSESRLQLQARTGFDPSRLSGQAKASFFMRRPALREVPIEDIELTARGQVTSGGLVQVFGGLDLAEAQAEVDFTKQRLIVTGYGDVGESPVQFTWRDELADNGAPAVLSASAVVNPDVLNAFGLTGRAYLTGEIPAEIQAKLNADGIQEADIAFDLRESRIDLSEFGWLKPAGEAARATLNYTGESQSRASSLRLVSERFNLDGDIRLGLTGQLQSLQLRRLFIKGMAEVSGSIERGDDQRLLATISGSFLNISSLLTEMGGLGTQSETDQKGLPIMLRANVERLRLRRNLELTGAQLEIDSQNAGLRRFSAKGRIAGGGAIDIRLQPDPVSDQLKVELDSSDAGFLAGAFFGLDFIQGGRVTLQGLIGNQKKPTRLAIRLSDTRLSNAPFFTQILSLASLRGLTDTLSGEGVLFTEVDIPLQIGGSRYIIDGARASGPALGLTANGWVGTSGRGIELDGVLVPSFGVNSMLGGVPIVGDLLVGRDGEGIFSITYSVRGTLEKAQIAVNPLSAVTPGILRRIFENPSDTSIPAKLPVDPGRLPPGAKLPDLPDEEILAPLPDQQSEKETAQ